MYDTVGMIMYMIYTIDHIQYCYIVDQAVGMIGLCYVISVSTMFELELIGSILDCVVQPAIM